MAGLKVTNGNLLITHRRKTFVVGLITASLSTKTLAENLLSRPVDPFKFMLTYKMSQDHLELLFSCIRGKNGYNNNPDVRQFKSSLKRILMRNTILGSKKANCLTFEPQSCGSVFSLKWNRRNAPLNTDLIDNNDNFDLITSHLTSTHFSLYKESILGYIAGYIVRKISTKLSCVDCHDALRYKAPSAISDHQYSCFAVPYLSLINQKDRGGLIKPSLSVFTIIHKAEKIVSYSIVSPSKVNKNISQYVP